MRGSGCSGGAFDLFDLPTTYDGYDAVETVAAQPWVKGGKVGLAGISFSGITPAVRRRHAAAAPRGDRADVGDRRPLHGHRLSRAASSTRASRQTLDARADGRREAGARGWPALRARARADGRQALPCQPEVCGCRPRTRCGSSASSRSATPSLYRTALARRLAGTCDACRRSSSGSSTTSRPAGTSPRASAR